MPDIKVSKKKKRNLRIISNSFLELLDVEMLNITELTKKLASIFPDLEIKRGLVQSLVNQEMKNANILVGVRGKSVKYITRKVKR